MATFNGARYVHGQVASILPQLEPGDELVVSDDGSDDATVAIVKGFEDPRIRVLEGNTFHSPLRNFEHAVRHARGDVIVLSDQDDTWLESKLPLVRELFAEERSRPFLVVLDAEVVDDDGHVTDSSVLAKLDAGPGVLKNLWTNRYLGCCMAFSRDLLDVALPFPGGVDMHDIWLGQLAERVGTTRFVPTVTMRYRRHAGNATGFEIRFQPVRQVRRRLSLAWNLFRRSVHARRRGVRRPVS
jgi:glycosyltransferase involved in cell wall biosynthesis